MAHCHGGPCHGGHCHREHCHGGACHGGVESVTHAGLDWSLINSGILMTPKDNIQEHHITSFVNTIPTTMSTFL